LEQLQNIIARLSELKLELATRAAKVMARAANLTVWANERAATEAATPSRAMGVVFAGAVIHSKSLTCQNGN
jgi:hypothetical protein